MHHISVGWPRTDFMVWQMKNSESLGYKVHFLPNNWPRHRIWTIDKFKITKSYLDSGYILPEEIVLFTDAYDACVVDSPSILEQKFEMTNAEILVNAECNQFPDNSSIKYSYEKIAPDANWPIKYLNSGCYIGYAYAINEMLTSILETLQDESQLKAHAADQLLMQKYFLEHRDSNGISGKYMIKLDYGCEIFYCAISLGLDNTKVCLSSDKRLSVMNNINGAVTLPSVLHANGPKMFCDLIQILGDCAVPPVSNNTSIYQLFDDNFTPIIIEEKQTGPATTLKRVNRKQRLRTGSVFLLIRLPICCFWSLDYGLLEFANKRRILSQCCEEFSHHTCLRYNNDLSLLQIKDAFIKEYFDASDLRLCEIEITRYVAKESRNLAKSIEATGLLF